MFPPPLSLLVTEEGSVAAAADEGHEQQPASSSSSRGSSRGNGATVERGRLRTERSEEPHERWAGAPYWSSILFVRHALRGIVQPCMLDPLLVSLPQVL